MKLFTGVSTAIVVLFVVILLSPPVQAETFAERVRGRILLQVQSWGEAWYVNPTNSQRIYLRDGDVAYSLMRGLGLGITNANLGKIPVGIESRFADLDTDGDGLSDTLEGALGTNPNLSDTDRDGYNDGSEVKGGYDPLTSGKLSYDSSLVGKMKGKILLQVESRGEAWYVSPVDGKRYYMKDGEAAYQIMRFLSLGITNADLNLISLDNSYATVNCGTDYQCLIDNIRNDQFGYADYASSVDLMGIIYKSRALIELSRAKENYVYTSTSQEATTLEMTDELRQRLIDAGKTAEEIADFEKQLIEKRAAEDMVGLKITCTFATKDKLIRYMEQAFEGTFSSSTDFSGVSLVKDYITKEVLGECRMPLNF